MSSEVSRTGGHYRWQGVNLLLNCHIQANAAHSEFCGLHDDRIKVRIKAPARDDRANRELSRFIAGSFGVNPSAVEVLRGRSQRRKQLLVRSPCRLPVACEIAPAAVDCTHR